MSDKTTRPRKQTKAKIARKSASNRGNTATKRRQYLPAPERREQILESARQVFARSGLKGSRIRELAREAGVNQATIFGHFESKEELFAVAVLEPLIKLLEGARDRAKAYQKAPSDDDLLPLLRQGMKQNLEGMVAVYPLLSQALFSDKEIGEDLYREQIVPLLKAQADIMESVNDSSIDSELLQLLSFGMFFALAMDQHMTGKTRDLEAVAEQLTELIMFGSSGAGRTGRRKRD